MGSSFNDSVKLEEAEDCVENLIENGGNLFDCVLESVDDCFPLLFRNNGFDFVIARLLVLVFATGASTFTRPNAAAFAAANTALVMTVFALCAGKKIGFIKIRTLNATMATVGDSCAIRAGAILHFDFFGKNAH